MNGVALLVMPVVFALAYFYGRRIRTNSQKQRKREGQPLEGVYDPDVNNGGEQ